MPFLTKKTTDLRNFTVTSPKTLLETCSNKKRVTESSHKNLDSCVMIRFIQQNGENLTFRSGGGITHLSKLADEYQEMKNKIYVPIH